MGTRSVLVLERGTGSIVQLLDTTGDGIPNHKVTLTTFPGLNHGLARSREYIYASTANEVYRWRYYHQSGDTTNTTDSSQHLLSDLLVLVNVPELVVQGINLDSQGRSLLGHVTRTLRLDRSERWLYISVGSVQNVDEDSSRSRIRRIPLIVEEQTQVGDDTTTASGFPIDFTSAEIIADGVRNTVGMAFDYTGTTSSRNEIGNSHDGNRVEGVLWGVDNGMDNLFRGDLGGDIHRDNPAEELNRFHEMDCGRHYGYPYCWTEYLLPNFGLGTGTVWSERQFMDTVPDVDCRNTSLYIPPIFSLPAHTAPLGIVFYRYRENVPSECVGGFPPEMDGYAFIALHGSWNRDVPVGYKLVYVRMDETTGMPVEGDGGPYDLISHIPPNAQWGDGFRPVDVDFDDCGRLLVSSDGTRGKPEGSKVIRIEYQPSLSPPVSPSPPTTPGTSTMPPSEVPSSPTVATAPTSSSSPPLSLGYHGFPNPVTSILLLRFLFLLCMGF